MGWEMGWWAVYHAWDGMCLRNCCTAEKIGCFIKIIGGRDGGVDGGVRGKRGRHIVYAYVSYLIPFLFLAFWIAVRLRLWLWVGWDSGGMGFRKDGGRGGVGFGEGRDGKGKGGMGRGREDEMVVLDIPTSLVRACVDRKLM